MIELNLVKLNKRFINKANSNSGSCRTLDNIYQLLLKCARSQSISKIIQKHKVNLTEFSLIQIPLTPYSGDARNINAEYL